MAECRTLSSLGALSLLLEHQGTARDVLDAMIRYQGLMAEVLAIGIEEARRDDDHPHRPRRPGSAGARRSNC